MTHEHDHDHHDHHHHLVSVGDEMDGQEQGAENIDPATVKQISGFLLRGRAAFARLAELLPDTNARVASLSPDVACKASAAATLCNSVEQDLGFYCQLMGIDPQFAQGFPSEASEQYATHWIANIMPNIIQQVFSRGLNPVMITVQNPRNLERLFGDVEQNLDRIAALNAEAKDLEANAGDDLSAAFIDSTLARIFERMVSIRETSRQLTEASNKVALESESDDDACLAAEAQFTIMRTSAALGRLEAELALRHEYVANPPKQINRFLVAWAEFRKHVAKTAFAQGVNGEVFLNQGPQAALAKLDELEQTLAALQARLPSLPADATASATNFAEPSIGVPVDQH